MSQSATPLETAPPPLPAKSHDVPWPTDAWPTAPLPAGTDRDRLESALERAFRQPPPDTTGETHALVVIHRGALVAERYSPGHGPESTFCSWSMAKSVLHAVVGILVREGRLELEAPAPVPAWSAPGDPRGAITLEQLLRMQSGLRFLEDYVDEERSDVIRMLFHEGRDDVAGFAEASPLAHPPGTVWSYSSGTSNIVSAVTRRALGVDGEGYLRFMRRELLDRLGMSSAKPRFDASGTWIGSSFVFATARDFARFGLLYLRDGTWADGRVLPEGWVDHARTPTPGSAGQYGAHFWLALDGSGIFQASGYRGQYTAIVPTRDLVVVRLGGSIPDQRGAVYLFLKDVIESFPRIAE